MMRRYKDIRNIKSFLERFEYLKLFGKVGESTFGWDRYLNQEFYSLKKWKDVRNEVIIRDNGCDLGIDGYSIPKGVIVHHMNPITKDDILECKDELFDPEFLICVSPATHRAIHYGDESLLPKNPIERRPNDTCPWRDV